MNKSEQLIACLEGEIAKRDARIAELEARYQRDVYGLNNEGDPIGGDPAGGYANDNARLCSELAAIKAQGVVMQATDGGRNPRYEGLFDGETEDHRAFRLNSAPVQQVSVPQCVLDWFEAKQAHVTAVDAYNARLAFVREHMPFGTSVDPEYQIMEAADRKARSLVGPMFSGLRDLAAAPAAPAADAGIVDMYRHLQKVTPYRFKKIQDASITDGGDVMYFHKDRFDAALLADMAAHCAKESK